MGVEDGAAGPVPAAGRSSTSGPTRAARLRCRSCGVSAATATFVGERPLLEAPGSAPRSGPVTVDDAAVFIARLPSGALATFEATRFATGRKNQLRIELNGERGSLALDLERLNELEFYDRADESARAALTRLLEQAQRPRIIAGLAEQNNLVVVADEVYEHLVFDGRRHVPIATLPGMRERTVMVGSAGKSFSVTGWKIGWVAAPAALTGAVPTPV